MNPYSTELRHHGILGQKWGKKNGPPYPLDAGDHSSSEKKAGWRKSIDDKTRGVKKLTNENKKTIKSAGKVAAVTAAISITQTGKNYINANKVLDGVAHIPVSTAAKKGIIKAGTVATIAALATVGAHKLWDSIPAYDEHGKPLNKAAEKNHAENEARSKQINTNAKKKYSDGFIKFVNKETGGFDKIDDHELLELMEMEYEADTKQSARRN